MPETHTGQPHPMGKEIGKIERCAVTSRPGWQFTAHHAKEQIQGQWKIAATAGLGFEEDSPAIVAAAAVISYLQETQKSSLAHLKLLRRHVVENHLTIDSASWRSLEIDRTVRSGGTEGSLLGAIDRTRTAMGARLLRQWVRVRWRRGSISRQGRRLSRRCWHRGRNSDRSRGCWRMFAILSGSWRGCRLGGRGRGIWRRCRRVWQRCRHCWID